MLELLASDPQGTTEELLVLGHGFDGYINMKAGDRSIEVVRIKITGAGRNALAAEDAKNMCGRFVQRYTWDDIQHLYELPDGPARNLQVHYNIAPTDPVNVVRLATGGATELVSMRWGLIPRWWKKTLKGMPASFNARAETVAGKPMFRDAFKRNRCIIPASGYYEWLKRPDGRQPYYITATDGSVLSFAGLWDLWKYPETGEPVISCTIIVTDANELTRPIHDRMPVVLDRANIGRWLKGEAGAELLRPAPNDRLRMWPVSRRVNKTSTGDDDPTLLDEVAV